MKAQSGFTLIELMITIVIMGILVSIAVPAYQNYVATSEEGVLRGNIMTIEIFQEDFFLRTGAYAHNLADIAAIEAAIGWDPRTEDGITYAIATSADPDEFYDITGTHPDGWSVCIRMPDKVACP
ncbi:MAG: prepilin-type N-terminal cleavage/methylation domain-containing protein [Pseudomonadales bacterium]